LFGLQWGTFKTESGFQNVKYKETKKSSEMRKLSIFSWFSFGVLKLYSALASSLLITGSHFI
jgi:hypothetical protein